MSIPEQSIPSEETSKPLRITQEMRKAVYYQNKGGRGVGRIEAAVGSVERVKQNDHNPYRDEVKLCTERAKLVTESYRSSEGEPMVLRRANAMAAIKKLVFDDKKVSMVDGGTA